MTIVKDMKVTFKRDVSCDYFDHRIEEQYPKCYRKWDSVRVSEVADLDDTVNLILDNEDWIMAVPKDAIEIK